MKTQAIVAATLDGQAIGPGPGSGLGPATHDVALDQARRVYLAGNQLPARWAGRPHFVVLQTDFGWGHAFLATWQAWQQDPARCDQLHVVALLHRPARQADLARAHVDSPLPHLAQALVAAWPVLTPNLHALSFEGGRVRLLLAFGEPGVLLRELLCSVDAFFLHPGASQPALHDSHFVRALARRAAPGATAAGPSVDATFQRHLASVGFDVQAAEFTSARWAPRFTPRGLAMPRPRAAADALVLGAGLAGAAVAQALQRRGWQVRVWDQHAQPAQAASGNPAGIFHGSLHAQDGPHARLLRAAALHASRSLQALLATGAVQGQMHGLLRLASNPVDVMQALLQTQGLPAEYVSALDTAEASQLAGSTLPGPAWLYPGGGWLRPASLVQHMLAGVNFFGDRPVAALRPCSTGWQLLNAAGAVLTEATVVVLANAADAHRLLVPWSAAQGRLRSQRGQVTCFDAAAAAAAAAVAVAFAATGSGLGDGVGNARLHVPVAGDGYALSMPDGAVLCGASTSDDDGDPGVRDADHQHNLLRLARLCGLRPAVGATLSGRVGWRVQSDDKLPQAGPVPARPNGQVVLTDQSRRLPRLPGLFVCSALGGRGITWAPLLGELLAAQISGTPLPLEQSLVDAVDPGRWGIRAGRAARQPHRSI